MATWLGMAVSALALVALCSTASAQWQSLNGGVSWEVRSFALAPDHSRLLVGGGFAYVYQDSLRANGLAWWDGENWSIEGLVDGNGDTSATGIQFPVYSLAIRSDTVFAAYLSPYWHYDPTLRYASMLAEGTWQACGSPEGIFAFLESNGRLFNGGRSDTLYYQYMPMVNEWVEGAWTPVPGSPFGPTGEVNDVAYWKGDHYFVGSFLLSNGARKAVRFDGVDQWTPLGDGVGGSWLATVCGFGDSLYVGGWLPPGTNVQSKNAQIWDGTDWRPFFPQVQFVGVVTDMQVHEGVLYVSGIYHWQGDTTWYGLLRYDGHQLCSIGGPMPGGDNMKMAFFQGNLYLGVGNLFAALPGERVAYLPLEGLVPDTCVTITHTGMAEQQEAQRLEVFPNPSHGDLQVRLPNSFTGRGEIMIVDKLGRQVQRHVVQGHGGTALPMHGLAAGMYSVVLTQGGRLWQGRFIVTQ